MGENDSDKNFIFFKIKYKNVRSLFAPTKYHKRSRYEKG
jgi:3-phenylpropionate/cinnamic acid dioxygenase small subunit